MTFCEMFHFVQKCDRHTRALILTIAVCYYAKLQCREDFEQYVAPLLIRNTPNAPTIFRGEIKRYFIYFHGFKLEMFFAFILGVRKYF